MDDIRVVVVDDGAKAVLQAVLTTVLAGFDSP